MKQKMLISFILTLAVLICPLLLLRKGAAVSADEAQGEKQDVVSRVYVNDYNDAAIGEKAGQSDGAISFCALTNGKPTEYTMEEYLPGLIAAEMPAVFEEEALKAQAVAARTYIIGLIKSGNPKHPDCVVCDDSTCCAAFMTKAELKDSWGDSFDDYYDKICLAVDGTDGEYLVWNGEPIEAVFHSSSAGATEDSGAIWESRPYLVSVQSLETAKDVPGYKSTVKVSADDFRKTVLKAYPSASFKGSPSSWLGECTNDSSGRVAEVYIGDAAVPGTGLRTMFALRSTAFSLVYSDGAFVFTATGYGHGVGMSQYGANVMAEGGRLYGEILSHYYPGTELISIMR